MNQRRSDSVANRSTIFFSPVCVPLRLSRSAVINNRGTLINQPEAFYHRGQLIAGCVVRREERKRERERERKRERERATLKLGRTRRRTSDANREFVDDNFDYRENAVIA